MTLLTWLKERPALVITILIAAVFTLVYHPLLTGAKVFTHDAIIWNGIFQYYVESIAGGVFPYWDPYLMGGTYFYPNISLHGLLDPVVLLLAFLAKLLSISPLTAYVSFRLYRLLVLLAGTYILFRHLSGSRRAAALSAGVLLFAIIPAYFRSSGMVDIIYLTPLTLFCVIRFLEQPAARSRFLYLAVLAFLVGMSMNVYVPTFYLFNLAAFVVVLPLSGVIRFADLVRPFREPRTVIAGLLAGAIVLLMMAPPLMVMFKDASRGGELFPIVRIIQKNDGKLKRIVASDITTPALSARFTNGRGVFSSYGNMIQLVYPDAFESVPFFADDLMSEVSQYIGIIPFLAAVIGYRYHASRYRHLALIMLVIITANMFSFEGMSSKPYNILQKAFNLVFPPLEMAEAREAFGVYFIFYAALLACMGFSVMLDSGRFKQLMERGWRSVAALCGGIVLFKAAITANYGSGSRVIAASPQDAFVLLQIAAFAVLLYLFAAGKLGRTVLAGTVLGAVLLDFGVYSVYAEKYIIADSRPHRELADAGTKAAASRTYDYFREPLAAPPGIAFGETIVRKKGALTYGNNHTLFSTKRYYDLLTHVPLENQLALSGVVYPVVRFHPEGTVRHTDDKHGLLDYLSRSGEMNLLQELYVEDRTNGLQAPGGPAHDIGAFSQYEDLSIHEPNYLFGFLNRYDESRGPMLQAIRANVDRQFLTTPAWMIRVIDFSPNTITIAVSNRIAGVLQYNDGWSRYWRAYDGERELPVLIANYSSKAVFLPPGDHVVRFEFDPVHYKAGLVLFYAGLAIASALVVVLFLRGRKDAQRPVAGA